ncbi:hypothetical protein GALMADRAFT_568191 [Galerina marginata CBS 339.88]|uniref:Uncharacterized protein n=1 Tax=Galerina marginata (strain CBS 339.88) TaxID=685588 RepID=A0A067T7H1_GALM3|nr:hypothetical protein GALMADRAFT_568191 [Galerina marginata CBS 339.88]
MNKYGQTLKQGSDHGRVVVVELSFANSPTISIFPIYTTSCTMFSLIRRISYGVIPRPDRPWEDDPTSNAPHTRRKRRLSSTERDVDADEDQANKKKARGESATPSVADAEGTFLTPAPPQADTQEVKEVTQGVEEVDLDGKDGESSPTEETAPEAIPLPEEKSGELDEASSNASTPPPAYSPPSPTGAPDETIGEEEEGILPTSTSGDEASPSAIEATSSDKEEQLPAGTTED